MRAVYTLAVVLLFLQACGDDFAEAQRVGTIDAFEAYLEANPQGRHRIEAEAVLETKYLEAAGEAQTLEAYDRYLERFPNGTLRERVLGEREGFLFAWARETGTVEGWDRYLGEYPSASRERVAQAEKLKRVASYVGQLAWTPLVVQPINLARDPSGPKNGFSLTSQVTNNGDRTVSDLRFTVRMLAPSGATIQRKEWPLVAPRWPVPVREESKQPLKPGETRTWEYTTEDPAPGTWEQAAELRPTYIAF